MPLPKFDHDKVYREFTLDGVRQGEKQAWYEQKAEENGVSVSAIREAIANKREQELFDAPEAKVTAAQVVANEIGATRALAIAKYKELLEAEIVTPVHNREGEKVAETRRKDNRTQLKAAESILKIFGEVNDKLEVVISKGADGLSDEELDSRIKDLEKRAGLR
jgi:hypothetical protein